MAATTTSTIETTRLDIPGNKRLTLSLRPKTESNGSADISIMTEAQRVGSITTKFMGDEAVSILRLCVARYRDEGKLDWDGDWDTLDWNPSAFVTVTLTVPPGQDAKSSGDSKDRNIPALDDELIYAPDQQPGTDSVKQLQESSDTKPTLSGTDGDAMQKATSPAGHDSVLDGEMLLAATDMYTFTDMSTRFNIHASASSTSKPSYLVRAQWWSGRAEQGRARRYILPRLSSMCGGESVSRRSKQCCTRSEPILCRSTRQEDLG